MQPIRHPLSAIIGSILLELKLLSGPGLLQSHILLGPSHSTIRSTSTERGIREQENKEVRKISL